jgi:anthranilate phosphoribosyltransferase
MTMSPASIESDKSLSESEMMAVMDAITSGNVSETEIAAFLRALSERGETVDEITGAARILRQKASTIKAPADALDCCGTGGDGRHTYNISTAAAFVIAGCGVPVAKHGNRASSSQSGAADVLEALGLNLDLPEAELEECLRRFNFAFLMAPRHHAAMRYVANVRKAIGRRTIFNLLGPLANPAGARYQLIGVFDKKWLRPIAETLKRLGTRRAWVVHGSDGLDEITTTAATDIVTLDEHGTIGEMRLTPRDFGLPYARPEDLMGGNAIDNARALHELLEGRPSAYRDIVLINAAAALCVHGSANGIDDAMQKVTRALEKGGARAVLENVIKFAREKSP